MSKVSEWGVRMGDPHEQGIRMGCPNGFLQSSRAGFLKPDNIYVYWFARLNGAKCEPERPKLEQISRVVGELAPRVFFYSIFQK